MIWRGRGIAGPLVSRLVVALVALVVTPAASACGVAGVNVPLIGEQPLAVPGGDAERGEVALRRYGCGACHAIPGVAGAHGRLAPPLEDWSERHVIAGVLPNTPEKLVLWIRDPRTYKPGTNMPDLDVSVEDARDMAAYLYTLR